MSEEWLTYREIGARLGLNVEAVRTRVRRAGWRTQPGNDGRTRVLIPDRAFVDPVRPDDEGVNRQVNWTGDLTGLVALLTAAEARISRLERQLEAERDRANEAQTKAAGLRVEVARLTAQIDRAEQASTVTDAAHREASEARNGEIAQLRERLTSAENRAKWGETEVTTLRDAIEGLRAKIARTEDLAERATADHRSTHAEAEARIAGLETGLLAKDSEIAEQRGAADAARAEARESLEAAEALRRADEARKGRGRLRRAWAAWRGE